MKPLCLFLFLVAGSGCTRALWQGRADEKDRIDAYCRAKDAELYLFRGKEHVYLIEGAEGQRFPVLEDPRLQARVRYHLENLRIRLDDEGRFTTRIRATYRAPSDYRPGTFLRRREEEELRAGGFTVRATDDENQVSATYVRE